MSASKPLLQVGSVVPALERARLVRAARRLAWIGILWHVAEFAIAVGAGLAASSVALVGFGADSFVEALAGFIVLWRFGGGRSTSQGAELRAQRLVAATFFLIAAYVGIESARSLVTGQRPDASWVGIALAAFTAPAMPILARSKRRIGTQLGSAAAVAESAQTMICAYLSVALLVGLGANALLGWWWADPITALVIAGVAAKEGIDGWRGKACGCC